MVPCSLSCMMRSKDFLANAPSPTDKASSMTKISGLTLVAMEKAKRTYMPLEYVLTGWSMNSRTPEKSTMLSYKASVSAPEKPMTAAAKATFSRPVNSGLKPAPNSSRAPILPFTATLPMLGFKVPHTICSRVDLPAPLRPMNPKAWPRLTSRLRGAKATNSLPSAGA